MEKIPIGIEGNGLLVVVNNETGVIELEDFERGTFEYIAGSIQELISNVSMIRNSLLEEKDNTEEQRVN